MIVIVSEMNGGIDKPKIAARFVWTRNSWDGKCSLIQLSYRLIPFTPEWDFLSIVHTLVDMHLKDL